MPESTGHSAHRIRLGLRLPTGHRRAGDLEIPIVLVVRPADPLEAEQEFPETAELHWSGHPQRHDDLRVGLIPDRRDPHRLVAVRVGDLELL